MNLSPDNARWDRGDTVAVLVLWVVLLASRVPWLDAPPLNADEGQYAAQAAYCQAHSILPFQTPVGPVYPVAIYTLCAKWAGPFALWAPRTVVLIIAGVLTTIAYVFVRSVSNRFSGILAGLLLVLVSPYFEGHAANREWFAVLPVWLGICAYVGSWRAPPARVRVWMFAAGLLVSVGFWFKDQAAPLLLVVPLDLACRALVDRTPRLAVRNGFWYTCGAFLGVLMFLAPFVYVGTLNEHLQMQFGQQIEYATSLSGQHAPESLLPLYFRQFYQYLPFRRLWVWSYVGAAVTAGWLGYWAVRGRPSVPRWFALLRLLTCYLLVAMVLVQLGRRFYSHYYLFLLPSLAMLTVIAIDRWRHWPRRWQVPTALAGIALAVLDITRLPHLFPLVSRFDDTPTWFILLIIAAANGAYLIVLSVQRARRRDRPWLALPAVILLLVVAGDLVWLAMQTTLVPQLAVYRAATRFYFPQLIAEIAPRAAPQDRLFVWGFRPELYALLRLEPASRFAHVAEVTNDVTESPAVKPSPHPDYLADLLADLDRTQPRWVVNAWLRSIHGEWYHLRHCPQFDDWLSRDYVYLATIDGCDVYERRHPQSEPDPTSTHDRSEPGRNVARALAEVERALSGMARSVDQMQLQLTKADLLFREGRASEASEVYRELLATDPGQTWAIAGRRAAIDLLRQQLERAFEAGNWMQVEACARDLLIDDSRDQAAWRALGRAQFHRLALDDAADAFLVARRGPPVDPRYALARGWPLRQSPRWATAPPITSAHVGPDGTRHPTAASSEQASEPAEATQAEQPLATVLARAVDELEAGHLREATSWFDQASNLLDTSPDQQPRSDESSPSPAASVAPATEVTAPDANTLAAATHYFASIARLYRGDFEGAADRAARTIALAPNLAAAHWREGQAHLEAGRLAEAIVALQQAVELDPALAETQLDLGVALARQGRLEAARERFAEALRLAPDLTVAAWNLAAADQPQVGAHDDLTNPERAGGP